MANLVVLGLGAALFLCFKRLRKQTRTKCSAGAVRLVVVRYVIHRPTTHLHLHHHKHTHTRIHPHNRCLRTFHTIFFLFIAKEKSIEDTESTRALYSNPGALPLSAIVDAEGGLNKSRFTAKARLAFETHGVCLVKHFFSSAEAAEALRMLADIILAPNPQVESIYFEGSLRGHLRHASASGAFEGETQRELVGDTITHGHQQKLLMNLGKVERLRYVRKIMGFAHSRESALHAQVRGLRCVST